MSKPIRRPYNGEVLKIPYYSAGEHYYPQIFFKQWPLIRDMLEAGAKALGQPRIEFREVGAKNENN